MPSWMLIVTLTFPDISHKCSHGYGWVPCHYHCRLSLRNFLAQQPANVPRPGVLGIHPSLCLSAKKWIDMFFSQHISVYTIYIYIYTVIQCYVCISEKSIMHINQTHSMDWFKGNLQEKPWFLPSNIGLSCKFSHHPILWHILCTWSKHSLKLICQMLKSSKAYIKASKWGLQTIANMGFTWVTVARVYGEYRSSIHGVYKPTNIAGRATL